MLMDIKIVRINFEAGLPICDWPSKRRGISSTHKSAIANWQSKMSGPVAQRNQSATVRRSRSHVQIVPGPPSHCRFPIVDLQLKGVSSRAKDQSAIGNQKSAMFLRDGVAGNTSGFEPEDEGSTPSPAAISFKRNKVLRSIDIGSNFLGDETQ